MRTRRRRNGAYRSRAQPAYAKSSQHVRDMPYGRRAQDRGYLNQQLDRRRRAKRENHLTELGEKQRRDGAGDNAAAATGERGSANCDGGNGSQSGKY